MDFRWQAVFASLTLQAAKGDNESAEVIANISSQLNGDSLTAEQEALVQEQLTQQEALELKHRQEKRLADQQTDEELATHQRAINDQINQQKRLVSWAVWGLDRCCQSVFSFCRSFFECSECVYVCINERERVCACARNGLTDEANK